MALTKEEVKTPVLPKEAAEIASLGGEVIVRGLLLADRLALFSALDGQGTAYAGVSQVLAATVVDANDEPIFTAADWEVFGAKNFDDAMRLFAVASRLSGADLELAKKN